MLKKERATTKTKLSLILTILGFVNIALSPVYGFISGFFLLTIGLYLGFQEISVKPTNDLAKLSMFFGMCGVVFVLGVIMMFIYFAIKY